MTRTSKYTIGVWFWKKPCNGDSVMEHTLPPLKVISLLSVVSTSPFFPSGQEEICTFKSTPYPRHVHVNFLHLYEQSHCETHKNKNVFTISNISSVCDFSQALGDFPTRDNATGCAIPKWHSLQRRQSVNLARNGSQWLSPCNRLKLLVGAHCYHGTQFWNTVKSQETGFHPWEGHQQKASGKLSRKRT